MRELKVGTRFVMQDNDMYEVVSVRKSKLGYYNVNYYDIHFPNIIFTRPLQELKSRIKSFERA